MEHHRVNQQREQSLRDDRRKKEAKARLQLAQLRRLQGCRSNADIQELMNGPSRFSQLETLTERLKQQHDYQTKIRFAGQKCVPRSHAKNNTQLLAQLKVLVFGPEEADAGEGAAAAHGDIPIIYYFHHSRAPASHVTPFPHSFQQLTSQGFHH